MTDATDKTEMNRNQEDLVSDLARLDPRRRKLIRKFFYGVFYALPQLVEELEFANLDLSGDAGPLGDEYLRFSAMLDALKSSELRRNL